MPEPTLTTGPSGYLVSLAEAKLFLGLETGFTDHDGLLSNNMIPAASDAAETYMWRMILTQTWNLIFFEFPEDGYNLFLSSDARKTATITYTDTDGDEQTVTSAIYEIIDGRLYLAENQEWPDIEAESEISIAFERGWADDATPATTAPEGVKNGLLVHLYRNYYARCGGISDGFKAVLSPYRLFEV